MNNYLYMAIITIIIIFIFSFLIQFAWIPILLFLLYWIYKKVTTTLRGESRNETHSKQNYYNQDEYYDNNSYTNQSSTRSSSVIEADYTVVDEEDTTQHR